MAIGKCSVVFDKTSVAARINTSTDKATMILGQQVLKDASLYVPEDQKTLKKSAESASYMKDGSYNIVWNTPYAKRMYYVGGKFTKKTAHKMWAHYAKAKHNKEWQVLLQAELRKLV